MVKEEMMNDNVLERSEVQAYISYLQDIINRMAANSSNCKNWLITIIAALLAIGACKEDILKNFWLCYIPIVLFMLLDSYYLGLERQFRNIQKNFVEVAKSDDVIKTKNLIYKFDESKDSKAFNRTIRAIGSFSIYFFYVAMIVAISLVWWISKMTN